MNSRFHKCLNCKNPFTHNNVFTSLGWKETQISGICEKCFDIITAEPEEEPFDEVSYDKALNSEWSEHEEDTGGTF